MMFNIFVKIKISLILTPYKFSYFIIICKDVFTNNERVSDLIKEFS